MRPDRLAAGVHVKEGETAFLRRRLRVISACLECRSGFCRQPRRLARLLDLAGEDVGDEWLGAGIRGIEHDQPQ
jgi:hypothetical protein